MLKLKQNLYSSVVFGTDETLAKSTNPPSHQIQGLPKALTRDTYLSSRETAIVLGVSYDKLAQDRCKGIGIPYSRIGRSVRYAYGDIVDYLEQHKVNPANNSTQN